MKMRRLFGLSVGLALLTLLVLTSIQLAWGQEPSTRPAAERNATSLDAARIGSWQCDPSGGPTCFQNLTAIAMVSPTEGWAVGRASSGTGSVIAHYTDGRWQ